MNNKNSDSKKDLYLSLCKKITNFSIRDFVQYKNPINNRIELFLAGDKRICGFYNKENFEVIKLLSPDENFYSCEYYDGLIIVGTEKGKILQISCTNYHVNLSVNISQMRICSISFNKTGNNFFTNITAGSWDGCTYTLTREGLLLVSKFSHYELRYAVVTCFVDGITTLGSQTGTLLFIEDGNVINIMNKVHDDIIRRIIRIGKTEYILTCSNDGYVKVVSTKDFKIVLEVFVCDEFIYAASIRYLEEKKAYVVVTGGDTLLHEFLLVHDENNKFSLKDNINIIGINNSSFWTIRSHLCDDGSLEFGAICDDGSIYIYSSGEKKKISYESDDIITLLNNKNETIDRSLLPEYDDIESVKGDKNGKVTLFYQSKSDKVFACKYENDKWHTIGEVYKSLKPNSSNKGKTFYQGDEFYPSGDYDYVLDIVLEARNNKTLYLPFNVDEKVDEISKKFCNNYNLDSHHVSEICNYLNQALNKNNKTKLKEKDSDNNSNDNSNDIETLNMPIYTQSLERPNIVKALNAIEKVFSEMENNIFELFKNTFSTIAIIPRNQLGLLEYDDKLIKCLFCPKSEIFTLVRPKLIPFLDISRIMLLSYKVINKLLESKTLAPYIICLCDIIKITDDNTTVVALRCLLNISSHNNAIEVCLQLGIGCLLLPYFSNMKSIQATTKILENLIFYARTFYGPKSQILDSLNRQLKVLCDSTSKLK